jgi:hypothetical protein
MDPRMFDGLVSSILLVGVAIGIGIAVVVIALWYLINYLLQHLTWV